MFIDQADIEVFAGDGGNGALSFRREKYIPHGGPDGGDGGDGGSVYLQATSGVDTLLDMVGRHHWYAKRGQHGMGKKKAGSDGEDLVIRVPPGTLIYDADSRLLLADLKTPNQKVCIAKGGKGGRGNIHFVTSVHQAPQYAEPGQKGDVRHLHLELRLIADVGLVGLPNAGKSTLLSRLSAARPKIADYPFTTLRPQLGIAELDAERRLVIADIPGLIEGAHEGRGMGVDFLRHVERTRVIVHLLDMMPVGANWGGEGEVVEEEVRGSGTGRSAKRGKGSKGARELKGANKAKGGRGAKGKKAGEAKRTPAMKGKPARGGAGKIAVTEGKKGKAAVVPVSRQSVLTPTPIEAYRQIRAELAAYSPKLAAKPEIVVANKMDLAGAAEALADLRDALPGRQIFAISAVAGTGLRPLLEAIYQQVQKSPPSEPFIDPAQIMTSDASANRDEEESTRVAADAAPAESEDLELQNEIAEMKADDQRKSKYYRRAKSDI